MWSDTRVVPEALRGAQLCGVVPPRPMRRHRYLRVQVYRASRGTTDAKGGTQEPKHLRNAVFSPYHLHQRQRLARAHPAGS